MDKTHMPFFLHFWVWQFYANSIFRLGIYEVPLIGQAETAGYIR